MTYKWFCADCEVEINPEDFRVKCPNPECGHEHDPAEYIDDNREAFEAHYPDGRIDSMICCRSCEEKREMARFN